MGRMKGLVDVVGSWHIVCWLGRRWMNAESLAGLVVERLAENSDSVALVVGQRMASIAVVAGHYPVEVEAAAARIQRAASEFR